jgi:hypothetical protein
MIPLKRLAAAFALGAGLAMAGAAMAQTPNDSAAPAGASAQPAPPPTEATTPQVESRDPDATQPVYSVSPPPDSAPDRDLPTVVGGYARSVAGCAVLGCDDDPQLGDPPGPLAPKPDETPPPPPVNAQPDQPR